MSLTVTHIWDLGRRLRINHGTVDITTLIPSNHSSPVELVVLLLELCDSILIAPEIYFPGSSPATRLQFKDVPNYFSCEVAIEIVIGASPEQ